MIYEPTNSHHPHPLSPGKWGGTSTNVSYIFGGCIIGGAENVC